MKHFDTFGVMIDMSRNAVMSLDGLRRFLPMLAKMGYNCIMLYTEDTYELDGEPYFGYLRGRYSKEEMKEIDAFAASLGMTVIPCIQTLAHLNAAFRWRQIPLDCDDILLTDDERTYELIDRMFATLSECFQSRKIHVGMDEAHMLGRGGHLDRHGYEPVHAIMKRHLTRICEIAKKYDYELMIWSDMFFRPWNNGKYYIPKREVPQEVIDSLPEKVIPVYWDYYGTKESGYSDMIENHKQISDKTWFAGGSWSWGGFMPFNDFTVKSMIPAMDACRKHGIRNVVMTMWGDDGAECSHFSQLPSLYYLAEYAKGNADEAAIKSSFEAEFGIAYDDFIKIDCPNEIIPYEGRPQNPSKYMLYSDYFTGFMDSTIEEGIAERYVAFSEELDAIAKSNEGFGYVFETAARLCDVLAVKYDLGVRTRSAYEAGNKEELRRLAETDYAMLLVRIDAFARCFEKQWMRDNKPHGFDVQDLRLGGLLRRTDACRRRLLAYADGEIARIDELEEKLLPLGEKGKSLYLNNISINSTVNVIHMHHVARFVPGIK